MKKFLPLVLLVFVLGAGLLILRKQSSGPQTIQPPSSPETVLPIEKRPYVVLVPRTDGHELKLEVSNIQEAKSIDYELLYMAKEAERGVIGSVDLKGEQTFSRDLTLGSCSKNVCKYDEGVTGGTLKLKLRDEKTQKYEVPFKLVVGREAKLGLSSPDSNFTFQGNLTSSTAYLVAATAGLPKIPPGKILGGPYGIFTAGGTLAKGAIKLKLTEPSQTVKILGWDKASQAWKEYQKGFETDGQIVDVEVDRLTTFVAVTP